MSHARAVIETNLGYASKSLWRARIAAERDSSMHGVEQDLEQLHVEIVRVLASMLSSKRPTPGQGRLPFS